FYYNLYYTFFFIIILLLPSSTFFPYTTLFRSSLFGYSRKVLVLVVIMLANVIDQILVLQGAVAYATVLFYIMNEGLSIIENLAVVGVIVPKVIAEKLESIESSGTSLSDEVKDEFTSNKKEDE